MNDLIALHSKLAALFPGHAVSIQLKAINFSAGGAPELRYTACISGADCEWRRLRMALHC